MSYAVSNTNPTSCPPFKRPSHLLWLPSPPLVFSELSLSPHFPHATPNCFFKHLHAMSLPSFQRHSNQNETKPFLVVSHEAECTQLVFRSCALFVYTPEVCLALGRAQSCETSSSDLLLLSEVQKLPIGLFMDFSFFTDPNIVINTHNVYLCATSPFLHHLGADSGSSSSGIGI